MCCGGRERSWGSSGWAWATVPAWGWAAPAASPSAGPVPGRTLAGANTAWAAAAGPGGGDEPWCWHRVGDTPLRAHHRPPSKCRPVYPHTAHDPAPSTPSPKPQAGSRGDSASPLLAPSPQQGRVPPSQGAGWSIQQPGPLLQHSQHPASITPPCYLSLLPKSRDTCPPVLGGTEPGGLCCYHEAAPGGCSTGLCPAGQGGGSQLARWGVLVSAGAVAEQGPAAVQPPLPRVPPSRTESVRPPLVQSPTVFLFVYLLCLKSCLAIILTNAYSLAAGCLLRLAHPMPMP